MPQPTPQEHAGDQAHTGRLDRVLRWLDARIDVRELFGWVFSFTGLLYGELDRRLDFREALAKALKKPVPKHVNWLFCFGGITFFLFTTQVISGILLTLYYRPTPEVAYESVRHIMNNVTFGWLVRGIHQWAANLMILSVMIHMGRIFFMRAYRPPRELNWLTGVLLLVLTLGFGFTGYLLPWDQRAYWATTVGTEMAGAVPFVGQYLLLILRGGADVTGATLARFYSGHVIILPAVIVIFLAAHFFMVRRQGISGPL
ncbi:MAG: cytochrome b N-terminal domain-containing protein [Syntrophothermus sp.]